MSHAMLKMFGHQLASIQNTISAMMTVVEQELAKPEATAAKTERKEVDESGAATERPYFGSPRSPAKSNSD